MPDTNYLEAAIFFALLLFVSPRLGAWMAKLFSEKEKVPLAAYERRILGLLGEEAQREMTAREYLTAVLIFHGVGFLVLLLLLMGQGILPLNPQGLPGVPFWLAVNTAVSFVTNTNWQAYSGEATLSYFSQSVGLTVQNFISAAAGIAVMVALARGLRRDQQDKLGNFWADMLRSILYLLLPLSLVFALILIGQGVIQNFLPYVKAIPLGGGEQLIPMGPAASQIAIKQLGTNGGGFFGVNSAHPFENPTPISNFLQCFSILMIPAALPFAFGRLVGRHRHGSTLFATMFVLFFLSFVAALWSEPATLLEGKEVRFGVLPSVLWSTATTVASNGSVNSMLSSFSPLAGGLALFNILLGEVVFGGVGSGVYGMVLFVILTVFIAGLLVGRTPEYLGKKIEAYDIKWSAIGIVLPSAVILTFTALAVVLPVGLSSLLNQGPHGFTEVLYAFSSGAGNNGSAFAGLNANTPFYNGLIAVAMVLGRFGVIVPVLLVAGNLARKKKVPASAGTLATEGSLFGFFLAGILLIVGALTFFPALCLGPIAEALLLHTGKLF